MRESRYDSAIHHRRSIRLPGHDYAGIGAYFITLCTQHRFCAFGACVNGVMTLNPIGRMVQSVWDEIPAHYPGVDIDAAVVMPNHFHGIIILRDDDEIAVGVGPRTHPETGGIGKTGVTGGQAGAPAKTEIDGQAEAPAPTETVPPAKRLSLPDVVHRFKSLTTDRYIRGVKQYAWPDFPGHFWQRNYWEHIIRDDGELARIRTYINRNPAQWMTDRMRTDDEPGEVREPAAAYGAEPWMM